MGHDLHFLSRLSRVSQGHVDLALSLYRDVALVKDVLDEAALPGDPPRVGVALDHGERPPVVVVTREGRFVTCLAEGMGTGELPIISRAALDGLSHRVQRLRRELEAIAALADGGRESIEALRERDGLSRERMAPFLAAQSLVYRDLGTKVGAFAGRATTNLLRIAQAERFHERHRPLLEQAWDCLWTNAHRGLLMMGGLREAFDLEVARTTLPPLVVRAASVYGFLPGAMRVLWAVAMHGKPMLPMLKQFFAEDGSFTPLALVALALRHPRHTAEVRKVLERRSDQGGPVDAALRILASPDEVAEWGRDAAAQLGVRWTAHLPEDSSARWSTGDAVPPALHVGLLARFSDSYLEDHGWELLARAVPLLARAEATDLYLPASVLARFEPQPPHLLVHLSDRLRREREAAPPPPARNGPCPCGSGKKLKRCCGG